MDPSPRPARPAARLDAPPAVELDGARWGPHGLPDILRDISFAIPAGQVVAICGANGAGKSSLLRLIYRAERPRAGSVRIEGEDLWRLAPVEAARRVAAVLQEHPVDFGLTARQIIALGRLPRRRGLTAFGGGADEARIVAEAIDRLDLTALADRTFATLSGGERQRVMVARALAQAPRLLLLDEPTNHLDIRHQLELLTLLRGLGLTVVTTLHDLTLAAEYADRVLLLHAGRLLCDGPPAEALTESRLATAFDVRARIDRSGSTPRFSFHL